MGDACLRKDRKQRVQAIGEARIVLQDPMADQDYKGVDAPVTSRSLSWIGWAAAAAFAVIAAAVSWIHFQKAPACDGVVVNSFTRTLVAMPAQRSGAATRHRAQHFELLRRGGRMRRPLLKQI